MFIDVHWCAPMCTDLTWCDLACVDLHCVHECVICVTYVYWFVLMCTDVLCCIWFSLMFTDVIFAHWCVPKSRQDSASTRTGFNNNLGRIWHVPHMLPLYKICRICLPYMFYAAYASSMWHMTHTWPHMTCRYAAACLQSVPVRLISHCVYVCVCVCVCVCACNGVVVHLTSANSNNHDQQLVNCRFWHKFDVMHVG